MNKLPIEYSEDDWQELRQSLFPLLNRKPDLNAVLFLIGVQELGQGPKVFSKEQKQDLMHIGTCVLLSQLGYYEFEKKDSDGWPHWKKLLELPSLTLAEQEMMLKSEAVKYFKQVLASE